MPGDDELFTVLEGDRPAEVPVRTEDGVVRGAADRLAAATGWEAKPVGWCRDERCVPAAVLSAEAPDGWLPLERFAELTDQQVVVDAERRVAAFGPAAGTHRGASAGQPAPPLRLPDLDGRPVDLTGLRGRKKLVVSFASWCGCAHDLPGWQALADELEDDGLSVVAVAIDEDPDEVRPFVDGVRFPVLIDRDRTFSEGWGIVNVPTVVWLDEEDVVVRPHDAAFGTETFREFTKVDSGPHHEALRAWARGNVLPAKVGPSEGWAPTPEHQAARLHFRIGLELWRWGDVGPAAAHMERAADLAPWDFTIRRAQLPLLGKDPFLGPEFLDLYQQWEAAGRPRYGQATGVEG